MEFLGGEKSVELVHQVDELPKREKIVWKKDSIRGLARPESVIARPVVRKKDNYEKEILVGLGILFFVSTTLL
jgi:hypothetical protein